MGSPGAAVRWRKNQTKIDHKSIEEATYSCTDLCGTFLIFRLNCWNLLWEAEAAFNGLGRTLGMI